MTAVIELLGPATGGIRTHVGELVERLRGRHCEVVVAGPASHGSFVDVVVEVPERPDPVALWQARRAIRGVRGDLIHAHGLKAAWSAIGTGRPVVLTAHNIVLGDDMGDRLNRWLERTVVRRVDHLISPAPALDAGFAALQPPSRRSVILPVSPPARPGRDRAEVRAGLGVAEDATLVVAVARLHPQKDLGVLLKAFAQIRGAHPDAELRIVGSGPEAGELARLARSLGLPPEVFAGPSPSAVEELAAADLVALSSRWEAVPLVVLEAMQLSRCIVTTRVGMVETLLGDGAGAIVDVGDVDAFAAALGERLADPQLRQREGMQAAARVDLVADPDRLVDAVCAVYRQVCLP